MTGKTTTTSLIYEILKTGNKNVFLGGNIGIPLFTKIKEMREEDFVVLELSSFQLMTMKKSPDVAVVTNITPNHLDIHKSYEEYIEAKANIFKYQNIDNHKDDLLVLNYDNEITKDFAKRANCKVVFFSSKEKLQDGYIYENSKIKFIENGKEEVVLNTKDVKLRGIHNFENICTALCATKDLVSKDAQVNAIKNFSGVEHRLEFVREINGTKWYNDSIGSSPTRTISGLMAFDENIVLIAGGYDKHLDYAPIAKPIINKVTKLILLGQTADKIYNVVVNELEKENKKLEIYKVQTLEEAVIKAKEVSKKDEVVLLSPASASFDMFKNFAVRGEKFKELVNKL